MNKSEAYKWAWDHNVTVGADPDDSSKNMAIVDDWDTLEDPEFEVVMLALDVDPQNFGFSDEYSTCGQCGEIIKTSPDSWGWQPDFWLGDGDIVCHKCLEYCLDMYVDWILERQRESGKPIGCILDREQLETEKFVLKISDLENGLHLHQTDDPGAILRYCNTHSIDCIFRVFPSQFSQVFDVYMRANTGDQYFQLTQDELDTINGDLFETDSSGRESLKQEYSNLRTGEACKRMLENISKGDY